MNYTSHDYKTAIRIMFNKNPNESSENTYVNCPYHADKTPSLSISSYTGGYQCFSCRRKGHLSHLCIDVTGKSMGDLLGKSPEDDFLSYTVQRDPPKPKKKVTIEDVEKDISMDVRGIIMPWYESEEAITYLRSRSIPIALADKYKMGFMEVGFINGYPYEKRLIIPIFNREGRAVAIEGRDITRSQKRKCIYPNRSVKPIFNFNSLDLSKPVYLFEGTLKKIVAETDDYFENSTSLFGSKVSEYQYAYLDLIPHIVICPDRDRASEEMVLDIKERYKGTSKIVEVLRIVSDMVKDHDEIPKKLGISVKEYREQGGFELSLE